jgi:hypothetical protein
MSKLGRATYILLIAACCAALFVMVEKHLTLARPAARVNAMRSLIGASLKLDGPNWSASRVNVVAGIKSGCRFCQASLPLYRRLVSLTQEPGVSAAIYAVSSDSAEETKRFLSTGGVEPVGIYRRALSAMGISATPTLFLVDSSGAVRNIIVGRLSDAEGDRLLAAVRSGKLDTKIR